MVGGFTVFAGVRADRNVRVGPAQERNRVDDPRIIQDEAGV